MDPFTAIGLVANIIDFLDFGYKAISASRELRQSVSGTTAENEGIGFLAAKLHGISLDLRSGKPKTVMTADELRLDDLVGECQNVSTGLLALLDGLKVRKLNSKRSAISAIARNLRKKDERDRLETRLDKCRQQLHLQLSQATRFVCCLTCFETAFRAFGYEMRTAY